MVIVVFVSLTVITNAQRYRITPNDTIRITGMMEDLQTLSIEQFNTTSDTLTVRWKKISAIVPEKWEASVCDNSFCNTSLVDSGTMNPIFPSEYGLLLLHITPHVVYGTAEVRYVVWDIATPLIQDTLTYILSVSESSTVSEMTARDDYSVTPNPATEEITLRTSLLMGFQYRLIDNIGKIVFTGTLCNYSTSLETNKIPSGVYSLILFKNERIVETHRIIIQH